MFNPVLYMPTYKIIFYCSNLIGRFNLEGERKGKQEERERESAGN